MDPISNMIIMLKNGGLAGKAVVSMPYSKIKDATLACLKKEGYVKDFSKKTKAGHPVIEVELMYVGKKPKVTEVERVSKQSRRVYFKIKDIFPVRNGAGLLVLSTPKGIMSGRDARKEQVGGEALFRIW